MTYFIIYCGIHGPDGKQLESADGFNSHDYLDGWSEIDFATSDEAKAWLAEHHKGPDRAGYTARFVVARKEG